MSLIEIKSYNNLSDLEKIAIADFSYSRIDTYNQCPAKYFYSYITKEPRLFNAPAALGNVVHSVLENTIEAGRHIDMAQLKDEYEKNISTWDPNGLISQDLISVGSQIINEFYDQNYDKDFKVYAKELAFDFVIGSYRIIGFIDRVDIDGNNITIVDYKTGKWEVAQKDVATNLQLGIYALAMHNLFPEKEIYAELYYLRSGRRKGHTFTAEDIQSVKINLINSINTIIKDTNFLPTSNTRSCSYCDHAKSGVCGTGVFRNKKNNYGQ